MRVTAAPTRTRFPPGLRIPEDELDSTLRQLPRFGIATARARFAAGKGARRHTRPCPQPLLRLADSRFCGNDGPRGDSAGQRHRQAT